MDVLRNQAGKFLSGTVAGPGRPRGCRNKRRGKPVHLVRVARQVACEDLTEDEARRRLQQLREDDLVEFMRLCTALGVFAVPSELRPSPIC